MSGEWKNIWTKPLKGPRGLLLWLLMVSSAGLFFAVAVVGFAYYNAPWALFPWGANFPIFVRQITVLWASLLGLELAVVFIAAVAVVFGFYSAIRRLLAPRISETSESVHNPSEPPQ